MTRLTNQDEWRLYLRDHKWWWRWPLIGGLVGVWLAAMVLFVAPWESGASIDDVTTRPATTEPRTDDAPSDASDDVADPTPGTDTTVLSGDVPASSIVDEEVVESLTPEPPTGTTPSVDDEAEVTEPTQPSRRRPTTTQRTAAPEPDRSPAPPILSPVPSPIGQDTPAPGTPATTVRPTTTVRAPTTTTTTVRPTTPTTTVRPTTTTTTEPPTTEPPTTEPPTTEPPTTEPPTTEPPTTEPPTTEPPTTEPSPPPPPEDPFRLRL